jgi:hypothetical protein
LTQSLVLEAIRALGGRATPRQIKQYLRKNHPDYGMTNWIHRPISRLRAKGLIRRLEDGSYEIGKPERIVLNFERELAAQMME